jgi:hypothetical protein
MFYYLYKFLTEFQLSQLQAGNKGTGKWKPGDYREREGLRARLVREKMPVAQLGSFIILGWCEPKNCTGRTKPDRTAELKQKKIYNKKFNIAGCRAAVLKWTKGDRDQVTTAHIEKLKKSW